MQRTRRAGSRARRRRGETVVLATAVRGDVFARVPQSYVSIGMKRERATLRYRDFSHYNRALLAIDARAALAGEPQIGFGTVREGDIFVTCDSISRIQPDAFETRFRIVFFLELCVRPAAVIHKPHVVTGRERVDDEIIRDRDAVCVRRRLVASNVLSDVFCDKGARIYPFTSEYAGTNAFAFDFADDDSARVCERVGARALAPTSRRTKRLGAIAHA